MRSRLFMIIVALVLGGIAAVVAARYVTGARSSVEAESKPITVLVAQEDIPRGLSAEELIAKKMIVRQEVPRRFVAAGAVSSDRTLEGMVLATPLSKGEQVTSARFQIPSQAGLAYSVPEDFVAISIPNDAERGVSGLIKPGDRVAVYVTLTRDNPEITKMMLADARVLAVGGTLGAEDRQAAEGNDRGSLAANRTSESQQNAPSTITLGVSAADAERLIFAEEKGLVWVALLPATTTEIPATKGQNVKTVLK